MYTKSHLKRKICFGILLCAGILCADFASFAQTYDPYDVQVINNLIYNNGLQATPDAPETWKFVERWSCETPKQVRVLALYDQKLTGSASFAGLTALQSLFCDNITLTELDATNCTQLELLNCDYNYNLTKLNVTNCVQLQILSCQCNSLSKLDVTNCTQLECLRCENNRLTGLDLTGLDKLVKDFFAGEYQEVLLTLYGNETGSYTLPINLNAPTFMNSTISYENGILESMDNTVASTSFTVQTGKEGFELSGTMNFTYSNVGISTQKKIELKVYPNPTSGELRVTSNELQVTNIEIFDVYGRKQLSTLNSQLSTQKIDISHLPAGIYFVKIITDTGVTVKKIVKQ